jgi:long-chain acyl-CoA synthetase
VLVDQLAAGLGKSGVTKGDRIGVLAKNSLEYFALFGAASALGAIMVPVNWRLSADEISFILKDSGPGIVFADQEYQETIKGLKGMLPTVKATALVPATTIFSPLIPFCAAVISSLRVVSDDGF